MKRVSKRALQDADRIAALFKVKHPIDNKLLTACNDLIDKKFEEYGNSWLEIPIQKAMPILINKLTEEYAETIINLMQCNDPHDADMTRKELEDLINVAAMLHRRLRELH